MSSTNRGTVRDLDDYYATPPQLARLIVQQISEDFFDHDGKDAVNVLEPGCGAGSFLIAAREVFPRAKLLGVELNPDLAANARARGFDVKHADVLEIARTLPDFHVIVGNPPFKHADEFIRVLTPRLDPEYGILAFILRLNFFGGRARYENLWSRMIPERIYIMPSRPGFTPDGRSDSIEYMVACFRNPTVETDRTTLTFLDNRRIENKWTPGAHEDPRKYFPRA